MKLVVTIDRCEGHGRCYDACPEVFEPDVEGYAVVRDVLVEDGTELAARVRHAALGCPERAIAVVVAVAG